MNGWNHWNETYSTVARDSCVRVSKMAITKQMRSCQVSGQQKRLLIFQFFFQISGGLCFSEVRSSFFRGLWSSVFVFSVCVFPTPFQFGRPIIFRHMKSKTSVIISLNFIKLMHSRAAVLVQYKERYITGLLPRLDLKTKSNFFWRFGSHRNSTALTKSSRFSQNKL